MTAFLLESGLCLAIAAASIVCRPASSVQRDDEFSGGLALAFAEGSVMWAYGFFLLMFVGGLLSRPIIFSVAAVLITLSAFRWHRSATSHVQVRGSIGPVRLCVLVIGWALGTAAVQAVSLPLYHFDAIAHFGFFAKW